MSRVCTRLKILIWDFQGNALEWLDENVDGGRISVAGHLTGIDDMLRDTMSVDWDYLFCFIPSGQEELRRKFDGIFAQLGIAREQVVYAGELEEWVARNDLGFYLLKGDMRKRMEVWNEKRNKEYVACTPEGISYIASSSDRVILDSMAMYGENWAREEMQAFYRLAQRYYPADGAGGRFFIDIGANIGTTCIYFKKKIDTGVDILAFEPEEKNYRLLRANLLLNGLEGSAVAENYGLSQESGQKTIYINPQNPGGNSVVFASGQESEEIQMVSLDGYLSERGISADAIKYLWIDTEGFEPIVLKGAKNTLKSGNIPVLVEFNPYLWNDAGYYDMLMDTLSGIYREFVFIEEALAGEEKLRPIEEIWQYRDAPRLFQQDIFLVK